MGYIINRGTSARPNLYCCFLDLDGKWKRRPARTAVKAEARRVLEDYEDRVRQGLPGCPPRDNGAALQAQRERLEKRAQKGSVTIEQLASRFLGEVEGDPGYAAPRIKDLASYRRDARSCFNSRVLPSLGKWPAAEITPADVETLRDRLSKQKKRTRAKLKKENAGSRLLSPASVVQTLAILSKLYNWARKAGHIDCPNPVQGVERPRTSATVDFLSKEEIAALLATAEEGACVGVASWQAIVLRPMVATAIYTGLRKGELFALRWRDLDLEAGRLAVARSYRLLPKSGLVRHVPIHPELAIELRRWRELCPTTPEGLVFPVEAPVAHGSWSKNARPNVLRMGAKLDTLELGELLGAAECHAPADGKPWHMLRHTYASHFVMAGGSLFTLQRLLGHSTPLMTQRYAHLAPDFLAAEVARMSFAPPAPASVHDLDKARRVREAR